jgi:hypothetical protein
MNALVLSLALVSGIFGRQYQVPPATPAPPAAPCPGGVCPVAAPALSPTARPPAAAVLTIPVPVTAEVKAAAPKPFPGPSLSPPRVLWVWDNGVVFDSSAGVWRWQNDDGTWNQK